MCIMKKSVSILLLVSMIVLSLAGCGAKPEEVSDLEYIKGKGKLIVGITDFAPMDYKDESGEWIGFDADLGRAVCKNLGVDIEFVEIDWDNKILELDNKSIDCVWNGMTLTNEVKSAMNCTNAYCKNAQVVVFKADKGDAFNDEANLANVSFAVEAGSAGEATAQEKGWNFTSLETQADALMEVEAGSSDGCIIDLLMAGAMIGEGTSYTDLTTGIELTEEEYGVGCRKGSDLTAAINDEFKKLYADGTFETLAKKYGLQYAILAQ